MMAAPATRRRRGAEMRVQVQVEVVEVVKVPVEVEEQGGLRWQQLLCLEARRVCAALRRGAASGPLG